MSARQQQVTVGDVAGIMAEWAAPAWAEPWDNVGLQVGDPSATVSRVLVALEATQAVLDEARAVGADLLLVHHPLIFSPLRAVRTDQPAGARIAHLLRTGMALYAAHTNLDVAPGGTNDTLAALCGLQEPAVLQPAAGASADGTVRGHGRLGALPGLVRLAELAERVKAALGVTAVRVVGDADRMVRVAAVGAGAGSDLISPAVAGGAQVLITGDIKYHQAQDAMDLGLAIIDPGHFATEVPVLSGVAARLQKALAVRGTAVPVLVARAGVDPLALW